MTVNHPCPTHIFISSTRSPAKRERGVAHVFIQYFALPSGSLGTPSPRTDTKMTAPISSSGTRMDVRILVRRVGVDTDGPPGRSGVWSDISTQKMYEVVKAVGYEAVKQDVV